MSDIIIGKHTLESLTSGMYSDPYVVFREYIQNSVDSIDEAIKQKVISKGTDRIEIRISPAERMIIIEDNGTGLPSANAEKTLISIGNSKKTSDNSRGFRGIGRLSALSYCSNLVFETSSWGEKQGTRIEIDALKLADLLSENSGDDTTVIDVIQKVYQCNTYSEGEQNHYFRVIMKGVDEASGLLSISEVEDYLSQNVPVPYNPEFTWGKEIVKRLRAEKYHEPKYNIYLTFGNNSKPIYKPYRDEFLVDKSKNIFDRINDISIIKIQQSDGNISAIGWLAKTNYLGSIYDKSIKGIRIRKGNILVGDSQTLNVVFKDARFNGWSIGELFAVDTKLIPNARRDNFEKNPAFFVLYEQLTTIAAGIAKDIRMASLKRNTELATVVKQAEALTKDTDMALISGVSSSEKGSLKHKIANTKDQLTASVAKTETDEYFQEIAFDELDMLIGNIQGATNYKAINLSHSLSSVEKRVLAKVFDVIGSSAPEYSEALIEAIVSAFDNKGDNN